MSTNKHIDVVCIGIMIVALVITTVFMNGAKLGIQAIVDEDAEGANISGFFTENDQKYDWDQSDATKVTLDGEKGTVKGNGAYVQNGNLYITSAGKYVVSGELDAGSIIVDSDKNAKIWIALNDVSINCADSACFVVEQAEKVFLTLNENTSNSMNSGSEFSTESTDAGIDAAVFARDDLTINGLGTLSIAGDYNHGIVAKDDLVITGGNISIKSKQDAINVNEHFKMEKASVTIDAGDDGIHSDTDLVICSGTIMINTCYEGIEAQIIDIYDGDITIYPTDDGINANGTSSGFGGFFRGGFGNKKTDKNNKEKTTSSGNEVETTSTDNSDNMNSPSGMEEGMTPPDMGEGMTPPDMGEGKAPSSDTVGVMTNPDGVEVKLVSNVKEESTSSFYDDGITPHDNGGRKAPTSDMGEGMTLPDMENGNFPQRGRGNRQDMNNQPATESEEEPADEEEESVFPTVTIYGGNITIINSNGRDADGIDSNGNIYIKGGTVNINLVGSGSNNALDYGSESGGICEISGGVVIATGGSSMLESMADSSSQPSVTYTLDSATNGECNVTILSEDGAELINQKVACGFSAITFSCPEMKVGDTVTVDIDGTKKEITIESVVTTIGSGTSMWQRR